MREAIINALIHRDYKEPADTRVFIFDDRFEVVNPGMFPEGVKPEKPEHKPVNPILCGLVYDIGLIEKYGSGISMMKRLSKELTNKEPYYEFSRIQTTIIFLSPVKETTLIDMIDISEELGERQKTAIWHITEYGKITNSEYCKLNNTNRATAFRDLSDMVSKGVIRQYGDGRSVYYMLCEANSEANNEANSEANKQETRNRFQLWKGD
ncbi:hypothetical protein GQ472_05105 [archaeon]|nr:hypothetical protein [archaeon]